MENSFLSWPEAFEAGIQIVGGKGWNLGRLNQYGFIVPKGIILKAEAYRKFVETNKLGELIAEIDQTVTIDRIDEKETKEKLALLGEKTKAGCMPEYITDELVSKLNIFGILEKPVAVRSSASVEDSVDASFAGIHDSFLNVRGIENILTAIKGCYASLWTPRAVTYRRKMNIRDNEVIPAVVIMEMVDAKASGIAFTCDPKSGREDILVINANYGLGECVVGGAVEPDQYYLGAWWSLPVIDKKIIGRKEGMTIAKKEGGTEFVKSPNLMSGQVLSDEEVLKLSMLVLRVFEALGQGEQHQDIEWVFDGKDFMLVQARPVTVLPRYTFPELKNQADIWSNANTRDAMPMVQSTLNAGNLKYCIISLLNPIYDVIGYPMPPGLMYVKLFKGRVYFNLAVQQWAGYDAFGTTPGELNTQLGGHQPEIQIDEKSPFSGVKGFKRIIHRLKYLLVAGRIRKQANNCFNKVDRHTKEVLDKDFRCLEDREYLNIYKDLIREFINFTPVFSVSVAHSSFSILMLVNELEKILPGKGYAIFNALMTGSGEITSAEHGYRLVEMAQIAHSDPNARRYFSNEPFRPLDWENNLQDDSPFKIAFQDFLDEYGHRGIYELDIINPRWREDPSYPLEIIRSMLINSTDLGKIKARQTKVADKAWQEIEQNVPFYRRMIIKYWLKQAQKGAELREMSKSIAVKICVEPFRLLGLEAGQRFVEKGIIEKQSDIFHCVWSEVLSVLLGQWNGKGLDILVAERKETRQEFERLSPPDVIIDEVPRFNQTVSYMTGDPLKGLGVAAGKASGIARLVYHPNDGSRLEPDDILVAPSTDPGWTPLFLKVSAIVMETGGYLSHGSIVAREYGVPAVVNIPGVMKIIENGRKVTVDGDEGKVYLEKTPKPIS